MIGAAAATVNSVQALLLYNIGGKELTAGELAHAGLLPRLNVSYNVKKLVETGYLHHARSRIDRRAVRISLTEKGRDVHDIVSGLYDKHVSHGGADWRHRLGRVRPAQSIAGSARAILGGIRFATRL